MSWSVVNIFDITSDLMLCHDLITLNVLPNLSYKAFTVTHPRPHVHMYSIIYTYSIYYDNIVTTVYRYTTDVDSGKIFSTNINTA